jgi:hydroxyproline transport system permease protein
MNYVFQWGEVWDHWPELARGAFITLQITVFSMLIGTIIAVFLAIARLSESRGPYLVATSWVEIARNTPALLQVYLAYFGVGTFGINLEAYPAVLAAISFNNAGYLAEIVRGGIQAVNPQQGRAGLSLGMTRFQTYRYIILPQVFRLVFLPMMNQVVWAMLGSSLGMIIGLDELTGTTAYLQSFSFRPFEFYLVAGCIYYVLAKVVILSSRLLVLRLFRY